MKKLLLLPILLITACTNGYVYRGKGEGNFSSDMYACSKSYYDKYPNPTNDIGLGIAGAGLGALGGAVAGGVMAAGEPANKPRLEDYNRKCMKAKGYTKE